MAHLELNDDFIQTEPLIRDWLDTICLGYAKRVEMTPLSYDSCIADMARNGWDDNNLIAALNQQTKGRFPDDREIYVSDEFPRALHQVFRTALSQHAEPGKKPNISLDTRIFLLECAPTLEESLTRRRQDVDGPNNKANAGSFF